MSSSELFFSLFTLILRTAHTHVMDEAITQFCAVTNASTEVAQNYLQVSPPHPCLPHANMHRASCVC